MCPSAYGSNSLSSMYGRKKSSNEIKSLKHFTVKQRLQIISDFYNKYPGYTLSIGPHKQFIHKMKTCKNINIPNNFYHPLTISSSFVNNIPKDIKYHIIIINQFLNNPQRPFNHKQNGGLCSNNTYCTLDNYGLVLYSTLTEEDSKTLSKLHSVSIATVKWSGFTVFTSK